MKKKYILVYDSGVGGLTTLLACRKTLPNENFIYYSDHENCPYGSKTKLELCNLILNNITRLEQTYELRAIVLACNTATTACISFLRSKIHVPIIGTEPNLKEPDKAGFSLITLLATPLTISCDRISTLSGSITAKIHKIGDKNLASMIENYILNKSPKKRRQIQKHLKDKLKYTPKSHAIVLGCTHYIFFEKYLTNLGYTCFNGNDGVSKRLESVIQNTYGINPDSKNSIIIFANTPLALKLKLKRAYTSLEKNGF